MMTPPGLKQFLNGSGKFVRSSWNLIAECGRIQRAQSGLRSIFLLELSLLSHRVRGEIGSILTQSRNQERDHCLNEYSDELMRVAASIARKRGIPARISGDSIRHSCCGASANSNSQGGDLRSKSTPTPVAIPAVHLLGVTLTFTHRQEQRALISTALRFALHSHPVQRTGCATLLRAIPSVRPRLDPRSLARIHRLECRL